MRFNRSSSVKLASLKKQSGAVWVEFLVVASTLLVSLFVLIPTLAKYMDIRHKAEQSAQYANWERTVWYADKLNRGVSNKPEATLINEAKQRVLADGDTLIFKGQNGGDIKLDSFHSFVDSKSGSANYTSLLASRGLAPSQSLMLVNSGNVEQPGGNGIDLAMTELKVHTRVSETVNLNGYYKNTVGMTVKQPSWLPAFSNDNLTMQTSKALLVDGWGVGGKKYNKDQVNKLQPRAFDNPLVKGAMEAYIDGGSILPFGMGDIPWLGRDLRKLDFDYVDSDPVLDPNNQLSDYYQ